VKKTGLFSLVLHAHLPFVRHPEHEQFLEERWFFEAVVETYVPLVQLLLAWERDGIQAPIALTLSPTLCAMLGDDLLRRRCRGYVESLILLAEKETHRTIFQPALRKVAELYRERLAGTAGFLDACKTGLLGEFARLQAEGRIEILTCAATHAVLPLLEAQPECARAQLLVARDDYRRCFGIDPRGIWLPECAYAPWLDPLLQEAGLQWFVLESHGLLHGWPKPVFGVFAPVRTPAGLAAFGRDAASARQVWSREEGYPGDFDYRDFYRDIGFDLEMEYLRPHLGAPGQRGFTGLKYYRITGPDIPKAPYDRQRALAKAEAHARHFLEQRVAQATELRQAMGRAPLILAPYDAELFGHWWFEGPEFLDALARGAQASALQFVTPGQYLRMTPPPQQLAPAPSSWGEHGHWQVWLNEKNEWLQRRLHTSRRRMIELAARFAPLAAAPDRLLRQAARELLLAESSDWPFILHTGTSPQYARQRAETHLDRFEYLAQASESGLEPERMGEIEAQDNLFPAINWRHFASPATRR
jgi:1,4-alpha-glucan branching enzyme